MNIRKIIREEFDWIKDISDQVPSVRNRATISYEDFFETLVQSNEILLETMISDEMVYETDEEGDFTVNGVNYHWEDPTPYSWEVREQLEYGMDSPEWKFIDRTTIDYDLEYSNYTDAMIFKRKSDGRHFAYTSEESYHGDSGDMSDGLYEMFLVNVPTWR